MERLTERDEFGNADIIALSDMMPEIYAELSFSETNALTDALNRLAAYEDTGLEPEEIITLKSIKSWADVVEHELEKYTQAEKDGRLVVLPCKPGQTIWVESCIRGRVTDIAAPDITWIIENTERFGKEIFLTRKEAEAALKKREEGTTNYEAEDTHREENVKKLLALVKDNPNLPITPMVDADLCVDDFGIYMGGFGAARVDSYVIDRCDMVLFKSDDDVFDTLERCLSKEEFETLPEAESECRLIYEALPWKEAIVVNIVIPEDGTT